MMTTTAPRSGRQGLNRRKFLAIAATGPLILTRPGWPTEKLNIAGIGVGGRGEADLDAVKSQNIVALCDVDEGSLGKASKKYPGARTYNDFREMLEKEQKTIDAVTVGTPDHIHAPASVMAMKMGKHVYCEKPLTHSVYECRVMRETAAKMKVATQMGTQGHAHGPLRRVVELVASGVIGPVREAHTWTDRPIWPQGIDRPTEAKDVPPTLHWDLFLGPAPERPYHPCYHPFKWRGWWDFGTGALGDMACHIMDPVFWALKLGPPSTVEAEGPPPHPETAPKWSVIRYEFPARDEGLPPLRLTWYDGGKLPPKELLEGIPKVPGNGVLFVGQKGNLFAPDEGVSKFLLRSAWLPESKFKDVELPQPYLPKSPGHHEEWIQACKGGAPALSNFDYATTLTEAVLLGNVAHRVGKKIEWDSENLRAKNCAAEAAPFIRREYRRGWTL